MSANKVSSDSGDHSSRGEGPESRSESASWFPWSKKVDSHGHRSLLKQHGLEQILLQQSSACVARVSYLSPNMTEWVSQNHIADNMCFRQVSNMRVQAANVLAHSKGEVYKLVSKLKSLGLYHAIRQVIPTLDNKEFEFSKVSKVRSNHGSAQALIAENSSLYEGSFASKFGVGLESLSDRALFEMCIKSKAVSYELQSFIENCQEIWIPALAKRIIKWIPSLLKHPFGNYVVQRLLLRSEYVRKATSQHCLQNLKEYAVNEFSSRVMQALAETDIFFRREIIQCATRHFVEFSQNISATLLVCACIRVSGGSSELDRLVEVVLYYFAKPADPNGYLLRHVVALVRVCPLNALVRIFGILKNQSLQDSILRCKKRLMVLVALLNRNFEPANFFLKQILDQIGTWNAIHTRYFTYLAKKLERFEGESYEGTAISRIFRHIVSCPAVIQMLVQEFSSTKKPSHQLLYICYLLGVVGPSDFHSVLVEARSAQLQNREIQQYEF